MRWRRKVQRSWALYMAWAGSQCKFAELERALRTLNEVPAWTTPSEFQRQHRSTRHKHAVVNFYNKKGVRDSGRVTVQGADAATYDAELKAAFHQVMPATATTNIASESSASTSSAREELMGGLFFAGLGAGLAGFQRSVSGQQNQPEKFPEAWHLYVDGSCRENHKKVSDVTPAGWGVAIFRSQAGVAPAFSRDDCQHQLYGPVVKDPKSHLFLGAEVGSNNTGELTAVGEALLWLRDEAQDSLPAMLHYDSQYAGEITTGMKRAEKNKRLAEKVQGLYKEVRGQRSVSLIHVKGHSGNPCNELADFLANQGAAGNISTDSKRWNDMALGRAAATSAGGAKRRRLTEDSAPSTGAAAQEAIMNLEELFLGPLKFSFGPLSGMPFSQAVAEEPEACTQALVDLQDFLTRKGLLEEFKALQQRSTALQAGRRALATAPSLSHVAEGQRAIQLD